MRALVIPQLLTYKVQVESDYINYLRLMDQIAGFEPSFFYVWMRTRDKELAHPPYAELFFEESGLGWYQQMVAVTGRLFELFNRINGLYPVDAVFTSRAGLVPALMVGLATSPRHPVPCVTMEAHVYAPGTPCHTRGITEIDAAARALGYAMGFGLYWSEWERAEALSCVEMWLSPAAVKRAEENSFLIGQEVGWSEMPRIGRADGRKRLLLNGRLNTTKRWRLILGAYQVVLASRTDVDVWVHGGGAAERKLTASDARWHHTSQRLSADEYYWMVGSADVAAYGSIDEGVCACVLDMIMGGVVVALPATVWVDRLFAPVGYPFRFNSFGELPLFLNHLLDHTDECRSQLEPIRAFVREKYCRSPLSLQPVLDAIHRWNEEYAVAPYRKVRDQAEKLMGDDGTGLLPLLQASRALAVKVNKRLALNSYAAYQAVRDFDDYEQALPYLRREGRRALER